MSELPEVSSSAQTRGRNPNNFDWTKKSGLTMTEVPERWMQIASMASVEQDSLRLNDLTTELILLLEEKGDKPNFLRGQDERPG